MEVTQEKWTEITVTVDTKDIETAGNIANMVVPYGIYIEDYSALEEETMEIAHIDLIEASLLQKDRTKGIIHIYISPEENPAEAVSFLEERLQSAGIAYTLGTDLCAMEDWVNNWKKYFHPMPVGDKLLIRPTWEDADPTDGRKVLHIEPGLAFGTGSHPTTRLCLETLEKVVTPGATVLDIGCGSGILSIAALLLGAQTAFGVDIDKLAVKNRQRKRIGERLWRRPLCGRGGQFVRQSQRAVRYYCSQYCGRHYYAVQSSGGAVLKARRHLHYRRHYRCAGGRGAGLFRRQRLYRAAAI